MRQTLRANASPGAALGAFGQRRRKARLLGRAFFADKGRQRLRSTTDLVASRNAELTSNFNNLKYLLRSRFDWMKPWIKDGDVVVEIGSGAGFAPRYLGREIILTDIVANDWLDLVMDGTKIALGDGSVDIVIASNALHHFPQPMAFLNEAQRVLKPGGLLLLNEAYCSLLMRALLRVAQHEGYSYDIDVFDPNAVANDPDDPWSGNNAVSNLLFDRKDEFEARVPGLRLLLDRPHESLLFVASGGVTAKLPLPQLPIAVLDAIAFVDRHLVSAVPGLIALTRRTVLQKTG
jgi:SAM-dependent methyltransferase